MKRLAIFGSLLLAFFGIAAGSASAVTFGFAGHDRGPYINTTGATVLDLVKGVGGGIYRTDIGTRTYNVADQLIAAASTRNIALLGILYGIDGDYNTSYNEGYTFSKKYAGKFPYYQAANERDGNTITGGDGSSVTQYDDAKYAKAKLEITGLIDGIRAGDPNAKIIVNFTWLHYGFIQRLVNDGVKFDIIGVDWYWGDMTKVNGNFNLTAYLKNQFGKPIIITEWNKWAGSDGGVETAQADYIAQNTGYICADPNITAATVYELLDEPGGGTFESHMGLMYNTTSQKPAYGAYKTAIANCGGSTPLSTPTGTSGTTASTGGTSTSTGTVTTTTGPTSAELAAQDLARVTANNAIAEAYAQSNIAVQQAQAKTAGEAQMCTQFESMRGMIPDARIDAMEMTFKVRCKAGAASIAASDTTVAGFTQFSRDLKLGSTGPDVTMLQKILNRSADTQVVATGPGSPGNETNVFGTLTKAAVIKFQEKLAAEILAPSGLIHGTGFVGPVTRAVLNTMIPSAPSASTSGTTSSSSTGTASGTVSGGTTSSTSGSAMTVAEALGQMTFPAPTPEPAPAPTTGTTGTTDTSGGTTGTTGTVTPAPAPINGVYHAPAPTNPLLVTVTCGGGNDETSKVQNAVNQVGGTGGTVLVSGTCMINAGQSVRLKSNMTLKMATGAVLKAMPNKLDSYNVVLIENATNVNVVGGTIQGERHQHLLPGDFIATSPSTNGEWGMALGIHDSSNVYVEGVTAKEAWGDGFYQTGGTQGKNINLYSVVAYDNRRQGLSIENVDGMVIRDSVFNNNKGTWPMSGIDLEPYRAEYAVTNIKILNNTMNNNQTGVTHGNPGPNMHISNVLISCNIMKDNTLSGIRKTSAATNEIVSNNTITGSPYPITSTGDTSTVIGQNGGNNPSLCPVK